MGKVLSKKKVGEFERELTTSATLILARRYGKTRAAEMVRVALKLCRSHEVLRTEVVALRKARRNSVRKLVEYERQERIRLGLP